MIASGLQAGNRTVREVSPHYSESSRCLKGLKKIHKKQDYSAGMSREKVSRQQFPREASLQLLLHRFHPRATYGSHGQSDLSANVFKQTQLRQLGEANHEKTINPISASLKWLQYHCTALGYLSVGILPANSSRQQHLKQTQKLMLSERCLCSALFV